MLTCLLGDASWSMTNFYLLEYCPFLDSLVFCSLSVLYLNCCHVHSSFFCAVHGWFVVIHSICNGSQALFFGLPTSPVQSRKSMHSQNFWILSWMSSFLLFLHRFLSHSVCVVQSSCIQTRQDTVSAALCEIYLSS